MQGRLPTAYSTAKTEMSTDAPILDFCWARIKNWRGFGGRTNEEGGSVDGFVVKNIGVEDPLRSSWQRPQKPHPAKQKTGPAMGESIHVHCVPVHRVTAPGQRHTQGVPQTSMSKAVQTTRQCQAVSGETLLFVCFLRNMFGYWMFVFASSETWLDTGCSCWRHQTNG